MAFSFAAQPATTGFGATATPTFGTTTSAPQPATNPSFGLVTAGTGFSFAAPPTGQQQQQPAATSAPFSFGIGTSQATATSAPPTTTTAFSFGTPIATTTAAAPALGIGTTQPSQSTSTFSFNPPASSLTLPTTTTTTQSFGFGLATSTAPTLSTSQAPATTATASTALSTSFGGLGGVTSACAANASLGFGFAGGLTTTSKNNDQRVVKELPVPQEILQIVEDLKLHMKNHKVKMTEINRASDKGIEKVAEETEDARIAISNLTNMVHRQALFCQSLMRDIQEEMKNVDMAIVTRDTPLALQNDISGPINYFYRLITKYQDRMIVYKREIERAEVALTSLVDSQGFSSKDLLTALKGTRETVMSLAAKVQDFHEQIVSEMMTHRNLKRFHFGDPLRAGMLNGIPGRTMSVGSGGLNSISDPLLSATRMEPVIPANINATYQRVFDKVSMLFNTPPNSPYRPGGATSTPILPRTGFGGPPQLFQTASSTILGSPGFAGGALKRSKR